MKVWVRANNFLPGYGIALISKVLYFQRSEKGSTRPKPFSEQQTLGFVGKMFLPKVGNPLHRDAASPPKGTGFPPTPLWKSQDPQLPFDSGTTVTTGTTQQQELPNNRNYPTTGTTQQQELPTITNSENE
jgi:hypothetical protein